MIRVKEITKNEYLPITSGLYSPEILCERVTSSSSGDLGLIDVANSTSFYIGNKFNKGIVTTKLLYNSNEAIDSLEVYDLVGEMIDKRSTVDVSFDNGTTWSTSHKQGVIYKFLSTSPKDGATQLKLRFNLTEEYDSSSFAWGTASSMNNARYALGGCGDSEKALSFGGSSPGITFTTTEKYLNNSWATTSSLNIARGNSPGCGDIYNALSIGGSNSIGSATSFTEKWNGTSWATTTALNAAKSALGGCGTVFSALSLGGTTGAASNTCEKWNGASWATTSVLNTARYFLASCGTSNSSLTFGGTTNTAGMDNTEKWSGTSWSTTSALNTARYNLSGCGDTTNALSFGGNAGVSTTEKWNSTSWVTTNALNVAKYSFAGCGTSTNALSFGGSSGTAISTSEKFSNKGVFQGFTLNIQKGHASSNIKAFLNLYSKGTVIDDVICEKFNVNTGDNSLLDLSNTTASYDMTNGYGYGVLSTNLLYASDTVIESLEVYDEINTDNAARATIDVSFDNGLSWATNKSQGVISDFTGTLPVNGDYLLKLKFNTPNGYSVFNTASSVWMTASNMNIARSNLGGCGTSSSALSFGGWSGAYINLTEKFNNTSWTTTSNLNQARYDLSGCGDTNSALSFGGYTGSNLGVSTCEKWNSTIWATSSALNIARYQIHGCGDTNSALSFGGATGAVTATTEKWSGSSWATTSSLNVARSALDGCGDINSALSFGGSTGGNPGLSTTEKWSGTSWTTTTALNTARYALASCGDTTNALSFGGTTGASVATTEKWNSTSWATTNSLNIIRGASAGCGTSSNALASGGNTGAVTASTERWASKPCFTNGSMKGFVVKINKGTASTTCKDNWFSNNSSKTSTIVSENFVDQSGSLDLVDVSNTSSPIYNSRLGQGVISTNLLYNSTTAISSIEVHDFLDNTVSTRATVDVSLDNGNTWATGKSIGTISDFTGTSSNEGAYQLKLRFNNSSDYASTTSQVWSTTSSLNVGKTNLAGCGDTTNALSFGGYVTAAINTTEKWSNTSWSTTSSLNTGRWNLSGCGTTSSALNFGGTSGSSVALTITEKWISALWSTTSSMNTARYGLSGCGDTTNALSFGGYTAGSAISLTEKWAANSWSTTSSMNTARYGLSGCGDTTNALSFGGETLSNNPLSTTEKWSGNSWATTSSLNTAKSWLSSCGTTSSALSFGGYTGSGIAISITEKWSGTSWSTTSSLNNIKFYLSGCGTSSNSLSFGGWTGGDPRLSSSEKFSGTGIAKGFTVKVNQGSTSSDLRSQWYLPTTGTKDSLTYHEKFNSQVGDLSTVDTYNSNAIYGTTKMFGQGIVKVNVPYNLTNAITSLEVYDFVNETVSTRSTVDVSFNNGSTWSTGKTQGVISDFTGTVSNNGVYELALKFNNPVDYQNTVGQAWGTTSSLNVARFASGGCGTVSSALSVGGVSTSINSTITEKWSGTSWVTTSSLNTGRYFLTSCGDTTSALSIGGNTDTNVGVSKTEKWSGSSWATTSNLITATYDGASCGSTTSALYFGGNTGSAIRVNTTYLWNGSSWATTGSLVTARSSITGFGTTSSAISCYGAAPTTLSLTEKWSGSTWATTTSANYLKYWLGSCGDSSNGLSFGNNITSEKWNGTSWTTTSNLNKNISYNSGCGTTSNALSFSGHDGINPVTNTEKWGGVTQKGYIVKITPSTSAGAETIPLSTEWYFYPSGFRKSDTVMFEKYTDSTGALDLVNTSATTASYASSNYGAGVVSTVLLYTGTINSVEVYDFLSSTVGNRATIDVSLDNGSTWSTGKSQGIISDFTGTSGTTLKLKFNNPSEYTYSVITGQSWATTSSPTVPVSEAGACGSTSEGIQTGGDQASRVAVSKWYNNVWATTTSLTVGRFAHAMCGTFSASIVFSGDSNSNSQVFNGSAWSVTSSLNAVHVGPGGCGTSTSALCAIGKTNSVEKWNGTSWSTTTSNGFSIVYTLAASGDTSSAIVYGGALNGDVSVNATYRWDGSSWATTSSMTSNHAHFGGVGTVSSTLAIGGISGGNIVDKWNGSVWFTTSSLVTGMGYSCAFGDTSSAITVQSTNCQKLSNILNNTYYQQGFAVKIN